MGKTYNKLRSQNYRFASDQNANEALKSATSFNEPIKKLCKYATGNSINSEKIFCFLLISIHASSADEVWY